MSRREQLEDLLRADPDDVFLHYALALECASAGDAAEAIARLDGVLGRDADYVAAYFQKGQILAREGDLESAAAALRDGVAAARRTGNAHAEGEMTAFLEALS